MPPNNKVEMQPHPPKHEIPMGVRPLSSELLEDCTTYIEEGLYTQAFTTLCRTFVTDPELSYPAYVPPPQYISLSATLSVHPSFNSRTFAEDRRAASKAALVYFKHVVRLAHIKKLHLTEALQFNRNVQTSDRTQRAKTRRSDAQSVIHHEERQIGSSYAHEQSLFSTAQDFWSVLGWAFNCSIRHKARWDVWRAWLEAMLDAVQLDLEYHQSMNTDERAYGETLLYQYLVTAGQGRNTQRRLMRAVFADGSAKSCGEFPEIWRNETSPPKRKSGAHQFKRRRVDIENDEYGDYLDEDSSEETPVSKIQAPRSSKKNSNNPSPDRSHPLGSEADSDVDSEIEVRRRSPPSKDESSLTEIDTFGGADSLRLRQRLLSVLVAFSRSAPSLFVNFEDLFALFTEFIRPLPLGVFQQLALPTKSYLDSDSQVSLNELLIRPLIAANAPMNKAWTISQATFEKCYAPFPALNSSAVDNAKCSLLVESMLRALLRNDTIELNMSTLVHMVENGIEARKLKVADDGRRKVGKRSGVDIQARCVLDSSALRMRSLLAMHRE